MPGKIPCGRVSRTWAPHSTTSSRPPYPIRCRWTNYLSSTGSTAMPRIPPTIHGREVQNSKTAPRWVTSSTAAETWISMRRWIWRRSITTSPSWRRWTSVSRRRSPRKPPPRRPRNQRNQTNRINPRNPKTQTSQISLIRLINPRKLSQPPRTATSARLRWSQTPPSPWPTTRNRSVCVWPPRRRTEKSTNWSTRLSTRTRSSSRPRTPSTSNSL